MTILAAAGSPEEGSNFTPPTLGEFMKKRMSEERVLRESRATARVVKEARLFHERQAMKHGIDTERGLAHMRAARHFSREAGMKLQEEFEQGGGAGQLDPKAVMKANKAAMGFHKKQAEKAGIDSDLGRAHTGAMEHHMAICNNAKQQMQQQQPQQPMQQEAAEGGPGSGPQGGRKEKFKARSLGQKLRSYRKDTELMGDPSKSDIAKKAAKILKSEREVGPALDHAENGMSAYEKGSPGHNHWKAVYNEIKKQGKSFKPEFDEALPGASGKQSPMPVPNKKDQPSQDIRMPVPSTPLTKLQQGEEWGPKYTPSKGWRQPMKASKKMRRIDRFGEGLDKGYNPSSVDEQLGDDKVFYGKKPKRMPDNSALKSREADGDNVYVTPRYQNIKPEGEIDPRDVVKTGQQGGGHAGGAESGRPVTMEGKKGWTERQRMMHSGIGDRIAKKASAESKSREATAGWRGGVVFTKGRQTPQARQSVIKEF